MSVYGMSTRDVRRITTEIHRFVWSTDNNVLQVAQLSQIDRAAGWVNCDQQWKTSQYRSIFNHCDVIGPQSYRIRWNKATTPIKVIQDHWCRYQSKARMWLPISEKKKKKLRDVTSHTFAQTTHVALPPTKLSCLVGSRT